jgi:hypothetical protein
LPVVKLGLKEAGLQNPVLTDRNRKNQYQLVVGEGAWKRLKERLKSIARKTAPANFIERLTKIKEVQRGWLTYFRGANIMGKLRDIDGWLRNRLRYCIWHDWKKPERKRKNLIRLGVDQDHAYAWSRTRKGGWAVAQSPILVTTITLKRLKQRGYLSLTELYIQLNPSLCKPPYTGPVSRSFGSGVRGALRSYLGAEPSTRLAVRCSFSVVCQRWQRHTLLQFLALALAFPFVY